MKKTAGKKLQLTKDTVQTLFDNKLENVAGGASGNLCGLPTSGTAYCPHGITISCTPKMC
jgi:hypothetical protein